MIDYGAELMCAMLERGIKPQRGRGPMKIGGDDGAVQLVVEGRGDPITAKHIGALADGIAERTKRPRFFDLEIPPMTEGQKIRRKGLSARFLRIYSLAWDTEWQRLDVLFVP